MKKIVLKDRFCMTRKFLRGELSMIVDMVIAPEGKESVKEDGRYYRFSDGSEVHTRFKPGDMIAVAMSYEDCGLDKAMFGNSDGWKNKMRVNAEYMPNKLEVERVRCVRVKDLSEEDMIRAGVRKNSAGYAYGGDCGWFEKECWMMFANWFDKNFKVPYSMNPWVVVYDCKPIIVTKED